MYSKTQEEITKFWQGSMYEPVVSICCLTYNHSSYIAEAIDSFLMQETSFPFEILIHDDASTDGTAEIIKEYERKYPNIVKGVFQQENLFSKGLRFFNHRFVFPVAKGKYIALCEGDDYWTSPKKLSKQLEFMEKNTDYAFCFHAAAQKDETSDKEPYQAYYPIKGNTFYFEDIIKKHFIPTLSVFFRKSSIASGQVPTDKKIFGGDIFMTLLLAYEGPGYYFNEVMGVYRHHDKGLSKNVDLLEQVENNRNLYDEVDRLTYGKFSKLVNNKKSYLVNYCLARYFLEEGDFLRAIFYLSKVVIMHPLIISSNLRDKLLLKIKSFLNKDA